MRCVHQWASTVEYIGHAGAKSSIAVTILRCKRCPKTLVQSYPNGPKEQPERKARREAAVEKVRQRLAVQFGAERVDLRVKGVPLGR